MTAPPRIPAPLSPPHPDLETFRDNLVGAMARKRLSASDVARAVWGSRTDPRGLEVAKNRDRMTHYMAGKAYPRPETVVKLAEVLDLPIEALAREPEKLTAPRSGGTDKTPNGHGHRQDHPDAPGDKPMRTFEFRVVGPGRVLFSYNKEVDLRLAMRLFDAIRAVDPEFSPENPLAPPGARDKPED